jgi:SPP1 gp7 family putative phage head morphogenesis protein
MNYWQQRMIEAQNALTDKSIKETEKQLARYYRQATRRVISDFEATYDKLLATQLDGKEPTPADLYKLDKYWQAQNQMRAELRKLGERQVVALTKQFEIQFFEIYYSIAIEGASAYTTIDTAAVQQLINGIWVADGKSWSQRVWDNTELLAATLNEEMINCVATGKKTTELKQILQDRFNVSYNNADMLVRTEMAHIQTQAAQQRYRDYGIQEVEVFVDEDERTCEVCASHEGEKHPINAQMPVPFHPRCRCCMLPVIN